LYKDRKMRLPKSEVALIGLCLGAVFLFVAACGEVAAEQKEIVILLLVSGAVLPAR